MFTIRLHQNAADMYCSIDIMMTQVALVSVVDIYHVLWI